VPGDQAGWKPGASTLDTQLELRQELTILLATPEGEMLAGEAVGEHRVPVDGRELCFDLIRRPTSRVQGAHDRAHARAGDGVHRHVELFEHLQDPDMRGASRAAAAQHQPNAGRLVDWRLRLPHCMPHTPGAETGRQDQDERVTSHTQTIADRFDEDCDGDHITLLPRDPTRAQPLATGSGTPSDRNHRESRSSPPRSWTGLRRACECSRIKSLGP
jgi:hypothetical protein